MIKVVMSKSYRYKNVVHKPYDEFVIEQADKDMLVKAGAVILKEDKPFVKKEEKPVFSSFSKKDYKEVKKDKE